jgi:hypothetical protein
MAEVTAAEFYRALDELGRRLSDHMDYKYQMVANALEEHKAEDRKIADAVLRLTTQRDADEKQTMKTSAWVALVVSSGLGAAFKWILK